ncbi:DUF547 domain-containing protein [bacterium]|nr:DUF547 domain-containing protein [bacterium]
MSIRRLHNLSLLCSVFLITPSVSAAFDYAGYASLLKVFVVKDGVESKVRYKAIKEKREVLDAVNQQFSAVSKTEFNSWGEKDQMAFLMNAYNSFTIQLIVDHYPVESIKDIGSFFSSPWKKEFFELFGKKTYLDQVEHEWLRKNYKEPRVHFAVNCASLGCPPLQAVPFEGRTLDEQLERAARAFVGSPVFNRYDAKANVLHLSSIFKWYGSDFGDEQALKTFIAKHLNNGQGAETSAKIKEASIKYLDYDWGLNLVN